MKDNKEVFINNIFCIYCGKIINCRMNTNLKKKCDDNFSNF